MGTYVRAFNLPLSQSLYPFVPFVPFFTLTDLYLDSSCRPQSKNLKLMYSLTANVILTAICGTVMQLTVCSFKIYIYMYLLT